jgi:hypothetical protein
MSFRIAGLAPEPFRHLFGLPDDALRQLGVERHAVDAFPGFPDRISLRDVPLGETVLLLNHVHQPADTPYRASHAIFVREQADAAWDAVDEVPDALRRRLLSLRAFDATHRMLDADVVEGSALEGAVERLFADPRVAYLHAHYAKRGCYAARIERA